MNAPVVKSIAQATPQFWPEVGGIGRVPLDALVPMKVQPRQHFDPVELEELAESMRKGGQREVITVSLLSEDEKVGLPSIARYRIVSGERRWRAARIAGLTHVEIRVKEYDVARALKLDAYHLNENRVGITDYEHALWLADMAKDFGWTSNQQIADGIDRPMAWVADRMLIFKLCPDAQEYMKPSIPENKRMTLLAAKFLSRVTHEEQASLLARVPKGGTTWTQRVSWMENDLKGRIALPTRKRTATQLRDRVGNIAGRVLLESEGLLHSEDFAGLFASVDARKKAILLGQVAKAREAFDAFAKRVYALAGLELDLPDEVVPEVPSPPPPPPKPVEAPAPPLPQKLKPASLPAPPKPVPQKEEEPPAQPKCEWEKSDSFFVNVFEGGRLCGKKVTHIDYARMWDSGVLAFQHKGTPKPPHLPTREQAIVCAKKFADKGGRK